MFIRNIWGKLLVSAIAIALSCCLPISSSGERIRKMPEVQRFDYMSAFRYVAAWASFDNDDVSDLSRNPHEFHGKLGSLNFAYSDEERVLHVWGLVNMGAGPLLTSRKEMKTVIDGIAREHPDQTGGGEFEVTTLPWNNHGSPKLEPCLYLRLDIHDGKTPPLEMTKRLNEFSTTVYVWNRGKMLEVQRAYWKVHGTPPK